MRTSFTVMATLAGGATPPPARPPPPSDEDLDGPPPARPPPPAAPGRPPAPNFSRTPQRTAPRPPRPPPATAPTNKPTLVARRPSGEESGSANDTKPSRLGRAQTWSGKKAAQFRDRKQAKEAASDASVDDSAVIPRKPPRVSRSQTDATPSPAHVDKTQPVAVRPAPAAPPARPKSIADVRKNATSPDRPKLQRTVSEQTGPVPVRSPPPPPPGRPAPPAGRRSLSAPSFAPAVERSTKKRFEPRLATAPCFTTSAEAGTGRSPCQRSAREVRIVRQLVK